MLWGSRIVVLDEPTAALGVQQTAMVYDLIRTLHDRGISVVLISHNIVNVFAIADRITRAASRCQRRRLRSGGGRPSDIVAAITGSDAIVGGGRR